ncbi:FAD-dependent 5-carboxymethylaminomethyl-2-thiouridine(34) oxidoreductase MnmC [Curvibacter lanceolatus]|uniref:FAD-dependent 5-carboxymethylaminomethyl-2-thiouridine(34) oxidoreductase MnmC n=1 Tax=Curvibacter lanceolatus TaxID=86182 RepID=UPI000374B751|nr:FAD-dependent 5-carboxymethylaminomethyl-2-thiouridine(34) oxidoreductase MnmC [Curvibacter lanceolatus]
MLQTGFGLGEAFLARWQAWRQDLERPARLQVVAIEPRPVALAALQQHLASTGDSSAQAQQLCAQWWGLAPGFHRLGFEGGQVELTLCVGELPDTLRELQLEADSVWLSAPSSFPSLSPPFVWDEGLLKALARLCRRGSRLTSDTDTPALREGLGRLGFALQANTSWLQATYQPAWEPRRAPPLVTAWPQGAAREAVVIGGGLSGLGTAHALARRGWQVTVLDACAEPAGGASGLPAGLFSPHVSPDDNRISRLTRTGLRITRQTAQALLDEQQDWAPSGVLEHRVHGKAGPRLDADGEATGSEEASAALKRAAGLSPEAPATWHRHAGWVRPARLVQALLAAPVPGHITWQGRCRVASLQQQGPAGPWQALDAAGQLLAQASLMVVAAGPGSRDLASPQVPLQALRGQLTSAPQADSDRLPPLPVNGQGSLIPHLPGNTGPSWHTGSTFDRGHPPQPAGETTPCKPEDHVTNLSKLATLLPATAASLGDPTERLQAWAGIRCTSPDRLPLVGPVDPARRPGLWLCTALGTRGLTWGLLCGELLAAEVMGDPLPVPLSQARALLASRPAPGRQPPASDE